jgi:hypothetical protein
MRSELERGPASPAPGRAATTRIVAVGLLGAIGLLAASEAQTAHALVAPTPTPVPDSTATPVPTPEPESTPVATPSPEPTPTPLPTPEPTPSPEPTPEPTQAPAPAEATPVPGPSSAAERPAARPHAIARHGESAGGRRARDDGHREIHRPIGLQRRTGALNHETDRDEAATPTPTPIATAPIPGSLPAGFTGIPSPGALGGIHVPRFVVDSFRIPLFLLPVFQSAEDRYGVPWEVLAAINEIETDYGRNAHTSSAGAVGWMQFLPSSWQQYAVDANRDGRADPANPVDAIFTAARYLRAAGAAQDLSRAVFAYNHAQWYVDRVLARAREFAAMPDPVAGSLVGLAAGRLPVTGHASYTRTRSGVRVFASPGAAVVAADDGRIVAVGRTAGLGRFVRLRDAYGNTYTYARLKRAGSRPRAGKVRLFAHRKPAIRFTKLRPGMHVAAGAIVGRVDGGSRMDFRIKPAGHGAPFIDPTPILASRRALQSVGPVPRPRPSVPRVHIRGTASRVLADPRIAIYSCGHQDIRSGAIDPRVLATLELLAKWHLNPTVSSLKCGHGVMTTSGNVSEHSTGTAVDISSINGVPIAGHQGPGSITERVVRRLLSLRGTMAPHQIITLMRLEGAPSTLAMADHADHIHIGWRPGGGDVAAAGFPGAAELSAQEWTRLVARLHRLDAR